MQDGELYRRIVGIEAPWYGERRTPISLDAVKPMMSRGLHAGTARENVVNGA